MVDAGTVHIVPPPDPSKTQKKKRRRNKPNAAKVLVDGSADGSADGSIVFPDDTFATIIGQVPEQANLKETWVVPESRVTSYASTGYEELNGVRKEDLKSLPILRKEFEDVKVSIESHETMATRESAAKCAETTGVGAAEEVVESHEVVNLVLQKRLKTLNKKISRIAGYASTDMEKLNDGQRRALETLPMLKKELAGVERLSREIELEQELVAGHVESHKVPVLQRRSKALNKKISRISGFASRDYEKLNDDQRRALKTLPALKNELKFIEELSHKTEPGQKIALRHAEVSRVAEATELAETQEVPDPVLQKRLKALNKKILRITGYASRDYKQLNDNQRRALKTLPSLKKELEDVKKLSHETDMVQESAARCAEVEAAAAALGISLF